MITVVGEILMDLIEHPPAPVAAHPGGSPANVAVALARLGQPVNLLTQLGNDPYGLILLTHLRNNGVGLAPGSVLDGVSTSTARTTVDAAGQASYVFDIAWRRIAVSQDGAGQDGAGQVGAGQGGAARVDWPDPATTCVHTGSLAAALDPGADDVAAMVNAARDTSIISFDPNCRPSLVGDAGVVCDRVDAFVATADVVKASLDDIAWLHPDRPFADVGRDWLDLGASLVVITLGGDGAWACTRRGDITVAAERVDVVDTVGAGDTFTAGLLHALRDAGLLTARRRPALAAIDDVTLADVVTFASRAAAVTCGRRGADPPTLADLAE